MGDKKHLGRFTVQFNLGDPQQARTAEILEQQGRQKARFISTAVLHYINCSETPEVVLPPAPNTAEIEKIVLAVLKKHTAEDGVSASTDDLSVVWKSLEGKKASCSMLIKKGAEISAPDYKNLDEWSFQDLLTLFTGIGTVLDIF